MADSSTTGEATFVLVDGMRIRYVREGRGPAMLLLHGSGSSLEAFDHMVVRLRAAYEVIRLDLPGSGLSQARPDRDYRIEAYVAFVARFLDGQGVGVCTVVGSSLGGNVAWNFALAHPGRVDRLVLMNATGYQGKSLPLAMRLARNPIMRPLVRRGASRARVARNLRGLAGAGFVVPEDMVERVHTMMNRDDNRAAFVDFARTDQADRTAELTRLQAPTLVLRGEDVDGQYFARDIPGSVEVVLAGVGRLIPEEAPSEAADAILSFLGDRA
jgi:pimeloyl-ACP methyl ester carboxylesterase